MMRVNLLLGGTMAYWSSLWNFLLVTAPFFLVGLILSGILFGLVSFERLRHWLGGEKLMGVIKAAIVGIPLPLCSCSVIPAAVTLKKSGAGNGATSSFLISTPETGVDSVLMSYAMMDIPMTILRPVSAFLSSIIAGMMQIFFNPEPQINFPNRQKKALIETRKTWREMMRFSFVDLLDDMSLWLTLGILAGAFVQVAVPDQFFSGTDNLLYRLTLLAVCIPLYICASATTPLVASLVMKGMSPGVGLLILLVGPAVNLSNILVLQKHLGKKTVFINVLAISLVALGLSYLTDFLYAFFQWPILFQVETHTHLHDHGAWYEIGSAVIMSALLIYSLLKTQVWNRIKGQKHLHHNDHSDCCDHGKHK